MDNNETLTEIDHVLQRPDLYMGDVTTEKKYDWVWDDSVKKMVHKEIINNGGLVKIIFEVIDNAVDNCSVATNKTTNISVTMDETSVTVKNNGDSVEIKKKDIGNGVVDWVPSTVFGVFRTGRNFNKNRKGVIGMNGMGVKLTNVVSTKFSVVCHRGDQKFTQTWTDHMKKRGNARVTKISKLPPYTTVVSFTPDLSYFKTEGGDIQINSLSDIMQVIHTKLFQVSVTNPKPIKIYFNGKAVKCYDMKAYMKLFTNERTLYEKVSPDFEYGVTLSPTNEFEQQSFVNCHRTSNPTSKEVKYVTGKVVSAIATALKKRGNTCKLSTSQISRHLFIFINTRMADPHFDAQTKTSLTSIIDPNILAVDIKKVIGLIKKSGLMEKLEAQLKTKQITSMQSALNGSKKSHIRIPKLDDALDAGTKKSGDTMLFLVEGDSAKTMVVAGMSVIGRSSYGVFPLKGKLLNVIGASADKLKKNTEICNIMKIIGLNFGKSYNTPMERKTLRYGKVCVLCDSDYDGDHITGLLLTFFNHYWPALVNSGFMSRFVTPIIKATRGATNKKFFFTMKDYEGEVAAGNLMGWNIQHLKGLGTSLRADTVSYFKAMKNFHLKKLVADTETKDLINHVFNPKDSNWRKEWLLKPMEGPRLDYGGDTMNISQFMKTEMYDFSSYNIKRAIPSAIDGLKVSQRKLIYGCFKKFASENTPKVRVAQLAAYVSETTNYAHGEVSLQNTITGMAQSFSGSNNMPLLTEDGAFGSRRLNGGDAASARYIFSRLRPCTRHLFVDRSENVLDYQMEEGDRVEPTFYVPTLPLVLINGSNGIATGFRTLLPSFNPTDIIYNIQCKLGKRTGPMRKLIPWYGGGYKTNDKTVETDRGWVFQGKVSIERGVVYITELPIGVSFEDYEEKVLVKMQEGGIIRKFNAAHLSENDPKFVVHGYTGSTDNLIEVFNLTNSMTNSCMNLLDTNGIIRKFSSPGGIFDYWYETRRQYIDKSHKEAIRVMNHIIEELFTKYKFIKAIVEGKVIIKNKKSSVVVDSMVVVGVSNNKEIIKKLLTSMSLSSLTVEKYQDIKAQYDNKKRELVGLKKMTINDFMGRQVLAFDFSTPPPTNTKRKNTPHTIDLTKHSKKRK
jgi:DNA topoisomerase-2